jgi:predicted nucleotidyltransferase component of viral defense system
MIELRQIKSFYPPELHAFGRNILREYLQYKILETLFSQPGASKLVFMGGTAIHIVCGSARFSEDLDFDNKGLSKTEFTDICTAVLKNLRLEGYAAEMKTVFKGAFHARFQFSDILRKNGLSGHKDERLTVGIDAEPQNYEYKPDRFIINRFDVISKINTVPPDILLSQKISCIFNRKRTMGRDFYDASFLLGKTSPNYDYLKFKIGIDNKALLNRELSKKCRTLDLKALSDDVRPFIFNAGEAKRVLLFPDLIQMSL